MFTWETLSNNKSTFYVGIQMAQAHFSPKSFYRLKIEVRHEFGSTNVLHIL